MDGQKVLSAFKEYVSAPPTVIRWVEVDRADHVLIEHLKMCPPLNCSFNGKKTPKILLILEIYVAKYPFVKNLRLYVLNIFFYFFFKLI